MRKKILKKSHKINITRDYDAFERSEDNRSTAIHKHKNLMASMKTYGWLISFPLSCHQNGSKLLEVKDGQHRLEIAELLDLPVPYVIEPMDYDIAQINCADRVWSLREYAEKYAHNGNNNYIYGLEFSDLNKCSIGVSFALLAGYSDFKAIETLFKRGEFKVRAKKWASEVMELVNGMVAISPSINKANFIQACIACTRVKGFDAKRLLHGAKLCKDKLNSYSSRDQYLETLQDIYNYRKQQLMPLKIDALMAIKNFKKNKKKGKKKGL